MNKRINQLINQLHLDPKKEAAVREIVENALNNNQNGGSNSGNSGPVIIELSIGDEGIGTVSLSDEQINAAKNYNIRLNMITPNGPCMLVPYFYFMEGENIGFYIRMMNPTGHMIDSAFSIDTINKTIIAIG